MEAILSIETGNLSVAVLSISTRLLCNDLPAAECGNRYKYLVWSSSDHRATCIR